MQTRDYIIHRLERFVTRWIYSQNQQDVNLCLFVLICHLGFKAQDLGRKIRRKHVCREGMQVPGLKVLNANVTLLPCGGSVEGDRYHTEASTHVCFWLWFPYFPIPP